MDKKHQLQIQKNYSQLVRDVNLHQLLPLLLNKGVFSQTTIEPYLNENKSELERKRDLFVNILRRGPSAFDKLVQSLKDTNNPDHYLLAGLLEDNPTQNLILQPSKVVDKREIKHDLETLQEEQFNGNEFNEPLNGTGAVPFKLPEEQHPQRIRQLSQEAPYANINLNSEPLKIKVRKAEKFFDDPKSTNVPVYPMRSKCRGIYLGINNMEFVNNVYTFRFGAEIDEENLKELFRQMHFKIQAYRNLTKLDLLNVIKQFTQTTSNPDLYHTDCVIVGIMSHGEEGASPESTLIVTSDNRSIPVSWLIEQFDNIRCPALRAKPKVFLFQICRGDQFHAGISVNVNPPAIPRNNGVATDGVNTTRAYLMRPQTDMLLAFSTLPGTVSYRDPEQGTWYVQLLCEVFMHHAHNTHIEGLLKMVDDRLQQLMAENGFMQTSMYEARAFKICYLHPGLYA